VLLAGYAGELSGSFLSIFLRGLTAYRTNSLSSGIFWPVCYNLPFSRYAYRPDTRLT
jgi:hypothetical protein